jgi:Tol biopolymer transport system component
MGLAPGTRFGAFEILDAIGAGGMGEVYRAPEPKLKRDVALKVRPEAVGGDPDRVARFQREAELLAALNHPNIAAVYGIEDSSDLKAIVMELVDGQTLEGRSFPLDEALPIARQIVDALEAAHDRGVIHRDLKPANIKITPEGKVKVLDFGLAKALEAGGPGGAGGLSMSPTLSVHATYAGMILGTAAYMSPEQARGKPVDRRTDIWSFGCVFYEMLSGRQAFEGGETVSDAIATILKGEVDWTALPSDTPPYVRSLLRRCLQKDQQKRLPHIGVVRLELDDAPAEPLALSPAAGPVAQPSRPFWQRAIAVVAGALLVGALGAMASAWWRQQPAVSAPVARFLIALPESDTLGGNRQFMTISRDGTRIAYEDNARIFVRPVSDVEAHPIAGVEDPARVGFSNPAFSPDGQSIAYVSVGERALKRVAVAGGAAIAICPVDNPPFGISWDDRGILFEQDTKGILHVPSNGGTPSVLVPLKDGELIHGPQRLPDGDTLLYTYAAGNSGTVNATWDNGLIVAHSLKTGQRKTLVDGGMEGRYVASGHIVYTVRGVLFAVPFDAGRLAVTGPAVPLIQGVRTDGSTAHYAVSETGSLIYLPGPITSSTGQLDLGLIDPARGTLEALKLPPGQYEAPRVSPDGRQVAFGVDDGKEQMVWVYELSGTTAMRRLTFGGKNRYPVWSADSKRIAFSSDREGDTAIFWQPADGTATAERLTKPDAGWSHLPEAWAPDAKHLFFRASKGEDVSLWALSLADKQAAPFGAVKTTQATNAVVSPDGRWVVYQSMETGNGQLFAQPIPANGSKYQLTKTSTNSHHPLWSRDGKKLFFVPGRGLFAEVRVATAPTLAFSNPTSQPRGVFLEAGPNSIRNYDATADGRLIGVAPVGRTEFRSAPLQVVLNWFEELKQRVPGGK